MSNSQIEIGRKIRALRKYKGLSLRDFEEVAGIRRGDMSDIETGKRNLTVGMLERIAEALEAEVVIFFREKER